MKTYVLIVSERFPITHSKKGEPTFFAGSILSRTKIHTIRANYTLWANRMKEILSGDAVLSVRYWSGKPRRSKQIELCKIDSTMGIGVQKITFLRKNVNNAIVGWDIEPNLVELAKNDGLPYSDFAEWFRMYDLSEPMAIIHFTNFRY